MPQDSDANPTPPPIKEHMTAVGLGSGALPATQSLGRDHLPKLKYAKALSDKKDYANKNRVLRAMMSQDPDAFFVDSDDGKGIVGITHRRTGFRIHVLKHQVNPSVQVEI